MKKFFFTLFILFVSSAVVINASGFEKTGPKPKSNGQINIVDGPGLSTPLSAVSESFEGTTFPPAGWTKISADGGTGWTRITVGTTPLPGWNGGTATAFSPTSGVGMAYATWTTGGATANDQWLISPQITNVGPGYQISFAVRKFSNYADNLDVKISTTGNSATTNFTINVATIVFAAADTGWMMKTYDIGSLVPANSSIHVALRERVTDNFNDGDAIFVDDFYCGLVVPVELTSFKAATVGNDVQLSWATATEVNNRGFEIQRKTSNGDFVSVGFVGGNGTTTDRKEYSFVDKGVVSGAYSYRLKQVDYDGRFEYSDAVNVNIEAPAKFELSQNYPNPFNPATKINFGLEADAQVKLTVFNILGQQVAVLANGFLSAGNHSVTFDAKNLTSGIYMAKIEAVGTNGKNFTSFIKMTLNK
ncbi:MAG: choice-of-anchor J domain-containing protein [Ignavibacteriaceae bacterium]|nr:choice-of-anchor J domain-containing protein [Ignavibacteriaceae bacterium]